MQSILLTAALMSAAVHGFVLPRTDDPNCEDKNANVCGSTTSTTYTVVSGDTLTSIAKKYNSGICDIASVNKISNPNVIDVGQTLTIPENCVTPDNKSCLSTTPAATETCVRGLPGSYSVVSGDTLTSIASDFNITLAALEGDNSQITNFDNISIGQVINIPVCPSSQCEIVGTYKIVSGDVYVDLAKTYHTTIGQIKALNGNVDPTKLAVGQQIVLPQDCKNVTTAVA